MLTLNRLTLGSAKRSEYARQIASAGTAELAHRHVTTCLANSIRPDGSTYHTFFMDPVTGGPVRGATCQGYKDDSCWARGQAWGVYGTAISYRYTRRPEYLDAFRRVLAYYLERLPEDLVPYWDMTFTSGTEEPRDSSSASIVACGLLEAGLGWGWLPLSIVQWRLDAGSLCLLPLQGLTNAQHLCVDVVWSNERPRGLAARRFVAQMHMQASPK